MAGVGFMLANFLMASVALPVWMAGDSLVTTLFNIGEWLSLAPLSLSLARALSLDPFVPTSVFCISSVSIGCPCVPTASPSPLSLSLSPSPSLPRPLPLSLSLSPSPAHPLSLSHTHSLPLPRSLLPSVVASLSQ